MSWHTSRDPARAGLPINSWPPQFRLAWSKATERRNSPFREDRGTARLTEDTLRKSEKGLRRWLGFLNRLGTLNAEAHPLHWLTPDLLDQFFVHLQQCENADRSILGRFEELKLAYELMCPTRDFLWLVKPNGTYLRDLLPMRTRPLFVPSTADLLDWADELYQCGLAKQDAQVRCAQIRDALMITILASRGPRLRALWSLRLGIHIFREPNEWVLHQDASITKTGNAVSFPLSTEAGVMADRYVSEERPRMLKNRVSDAFWIGWHGHPLARTSISGLIWDRSLERFGTGFGPHRFRTSLTTTLAMESPSTPWDASVLLAHGPRTSLSNYNKAKASGAARRHCDGLTDLRRKSEALARKAFGQAAC